MNRKLFSGIVLVGAAGSVSSLASCGRSWRTGGDPNSAPSRDLRRVDISVAANAGETVQLRALGCYIHPPVTKDITNHSHLGVNEHADAYRRFYWPAEGDRHGVWGLSHFGHGKDQHQLRGAVLERSDRDRVHDRERGLLYGRRWWRHCAGADPHFWGWRLGTGDEFSCESELRQPDALRCPVHQRHTGDADRQSARRLILRKLVESSPATTNPCTVTLTANRTVVATFN